MNLNDLETFAMVAECGSFSAAAQKLKVPKSTVSRRVRRLEDALGVELCRRGNRRIALTENGHSLHNRCAPSLRELNAVADMLLDADAEPTGLLRITTVPGFGQSQKFLCCIRDYGLKYPRTTIELQLTTRLVDLVEEGLDIGIRLYTGDLPGGPELMAKRLLSFARAMYASPAYVDEEGMPQTLAALGLHRLAVHSIVDVRELQWKFRGQPISTPQERPSPRWLINDSAALERFALSGGGIAMLSTIDGDRLVEEGALIRVLPDYEQHEAMASVIWPKSRHLAPRIRAFIDHAVSYFGAESGSN